MNAIFLNRALAFALALAPGSAWADQSVVGRITYIYPDHHRIILDSNYVYELAFSTDASSVAVANLVKLKIVDRNGHRVATQMTKLA